MRHSSESFDRSVQLKHCYHDSHHNWIFFIYIFPSAVLPSVALGFFRMASTQRPVLFQYCMEKPPSKGTFQWLRQWRELGLIPESERSPGEGNGSPLQYSSLENPMDGGAWQAAVLGVAKSWTLLSDFPVLFLGEWKSFTICTGRVNESPALNTFSFGADSSNQSCELLFQELSPTLFSPPCFISFPPSLH